MATVLVVDDEPFVLELLVEEFRREYKVLAAFTYDDAIAYLDSCDDITAVIADWRLGPGPDGLDLLREARERFPDAVRMMVSAHVGDFLTDVVLSTGVASACVSKPWDVGSLCTELGRLQREAESKLLEETITHDMLQGHEAVESREP